MSFNPTVCQLVSRQFCCQSFLLCHDNFLQVFYWALWSLATIVTVFITDELFISIIKK